MCDMKKFALRFALIVSAISTGFADQTAPINEAALKEELVKMEKQSWEAWKNRDGKFFQEFLSEDHVEVGFGDRAHPRRLSSLPGLSRPGLRVAAYGVGDRAVARAPCSQPGGKSAGSLG